LALGEWWRVAKIGDRMKEKIDVLLRTLGNAFPGAPIDYKNVEGRHKIYLTLPTGTHRLDFSEEVVAGKDAGHLKRMCKQVVAHLQHSPDGKTKHLLVKGDGIHEEF
jgi:hypothetical protein